MIFPYKPLKNVIESIEFLSDVIESWDGTEERLIARHAPRHTYDCKYMVDSARAKALLAYLQAGEFDLPLWQFAAPVTVLSGVDTVSVDTRYADYQDEAILWANDFTNEIVEIESKTESQLTLADNTVNDYPAGSYVMPSRTARVLDVISAPDLTNRYNTIKVVWKSTDNHLLDGQDLTQYKGYDMVEWGTLLSGDTVDREIIRPLEWIDYDTGIFRAVSRLDYSRLNSTGVRGLFDSRAEVWDYRQWLHKLRGRIYPFWLPTFSSDIRIVDDFTSVDTTLTIERIDYVWVYDSPMFSHLAFRLPDGTIYPREVLGCIASSGTETIEIDTPLGVAGGPETFQVVSFMPLVRMSSDRIEINWHRPDLIETVFGVVGVES